MKSQTKGTVTYYGKKGKVVGVKPIHFGSTHLDRVLLFRSNPLWTHYSLHDSSLGMKRDDNTNWYEIDLKSGLIVSQLQKETETSQAPSI